MEAPSGNEMDILKENITPPQENEETSTGSGTQGTPQPMNI